MTDTDRRNAFHANGDSTYAKHFGPIIAVTSMTLKSSNRQTIAYTFRNGAHLDLTPEDAEELVSRTITALAALPLIPNVSGALADLEGLTP